MTKAFKKVLSLALCLMMLAGMCSVGSVTASAEDKNFTISVDQTLTVELGAGEAAWISFTPTASGTFTVYSTGDYDTKVYLYDSSNKQIGYNDDGGSGNNFWLECNLKAGETYKLRAYFYYSDTSGSFDVVICQTKCNTF